MIKLFNKQKLTNISIWVHGDNFMIEKSSRHDPTCGRYKQINQYGYHEHHSLTSIPVANNNIRKIKQELIEKHGYMKEL